MPFVEEQQVLKKAIQQLVSVVIVQVLSFCFAINIKFRSQKTKKEFTDTCEH
jgi:hypothetical protein